MVTTSRSQSCPARPSHACSTPTPTRFARCVSRPHLPPSHDPNFPRLDPAYNAAAARAGAKGRNEAGEKKGGAGSPGVFSSLGAFLLRFSRPLANACVKRSRLNQRRYMANSRRKTRRERRQGGEEEKESPTPHRFSRFPRASFASQTQGKAYLWPQCPSRVALALSWFWKWCSGRWMRCCVRGN